MVVADAALIGGTGIGSRLAEWGGAPFCVPTPFGSVRGKLVDRDGIRLALLQRHAPGHRISPHDVPYGALGYALAQMRVDVCMASAAVGSLRTDWAPGAIAVCGSFLDFTGRQVTRWSTPPRHCDMQRAMEGGLYLREAAQELGIRVNEGAVYVGMDGPRYETAAEIVMLKRAGGDVVGMTASSEAIALAENGILYGCLSVVTNLGAGLTKGILSHGEVTDVMEERGKEVVDILVLAATKAVADYRASMAQDPG